METIEEELTDDLNEAKIQKRLELELGGEHKSCPTGIADIVTDTELIEIKRWNNWKYALGQLIAYSPYFPNRQLRCHFYGEVREELSQIIISALEKLSIKVTMEPNSILVSGKRKIEDNDCNDTKIENEIINTPENNSDNFVYTEKFINEVKLVSKRDIKKDYCKFVKGFLSKTKNDPKEFSISTSEVATLLNVKHHHVNRMVIPELAKKYSIKVSYVEGKDYIKKGRKTFLNHYCFKDVCLRMRGKSAKIVRHYFIMECEYKKRITKNVEVDTTIL
jgi:hypothetical protein